MCTFMHEISKLRDHSLSYTVDRKCHDDLSTETLPADDDASSTTSRSGYGVTSPDTDFRSQPIIQWQWPYTPSLMRNYTVSDMPDAMQTHFRHMLTFLPCQCPMCYAQLLSDFTRARLPHW